MGFLKDLWSGTSSSQNPERRPSYLPKAQPSPLPSKTVAPALPASQRALAKFEEGLNLCEAGHTRQGMEAFLAATEIDANCVDAWFALGKCFHGIDPIKYADEILDCGQHALRADPNNVKGKNLAAAGYFEKGKIAWESQDWPEAYDCYRRSYGLNPEGQDALDLYCVCAAKAGKYTEFAADLRERLNGAADSHPARAVLGRALVKMSLTEPFSSNYGEMSELLREAEMHLTKFLASNSRDPVANYFLGYAYVGQGRTRLAAEIVSKLAEIDIQRSKDLQEVLES